MKNNKYKPSSSLRGRRARTPLVLAIAAALVFISLNMAKAERVDQLSSQQTDFLKDVDTLVFRYQQPMLAFSIFPNDQDFENAISKSMAEVVKGNEWITTGYYLIRDPKHGNHLFPGLDKPNVLQLIVSFSSQKTTDETGRELKLGAATVQLYSQAKDMWFPEYQAAMPFVISENKETNIKNVQEAVTALARDLPKFLRCAHKLEPYVCNSSRTYGDSTHTQWEQKRQPNQSYGAPGEDKIISSSSEEERKFRKVLKLD